MAATHVFSVRLAEKYGPIEAIILSNICWWVETNQKNGKHFYDGKFWTYGSASAFKKIFTYLRAEQIKYCLRTLREKGALLTGNYNKMKYDRTLWYTVSEEVRALYDGRPAGGGRGSGEERRRREEGEEEEKKEKEEKEEKNAGEADGEAGGAEKTGERAGSGGECADGDSHDGNSRYGKARMDVPAGWEGPEGDSGEGISRHGNGQTAIPMMEIPAMDNGNSHDPLREFPPPIPFVNIIKKAAAAESGGSNGGLSGTVKEKAAAADCFSGGKELRAFLAGRRGDFVFDGGFYTKALERMRRNGLGSGYLDWLIEQCERRKGRNPRGLFYRLFFADDILSLYKAGGGIPAAEAGALLACPACGEVHRADVRECPACGLYKDRYADREAVERQVRINALPADVRREYEKEMTEAFFRMNRERNSPEARDQWVAIERRYHIVR